MGWDGVGWGGVRTGEMGWDQGMGWDGVGSRDAHFE